MSIDQAFNDSIAYYDDWMKRALLGYDDLFGSAVRIIPFESDRAIEVLDLGAGTGSFAAHVFTKYPNASFILYDVADKMLESARERFKAHPAGQFQTVIGDYRNLQVPHDFDLIISSLSIHHLEDPEKEALFHDIYKHLRPGGLFINIDQVRAETPALRDLYWQRWLSHVKQSGASEEQISESIKRRTTYDRDALLSNQLRWLKESGFTDVDCIYKNFFVAVFLAVKS